MNFLNLFRSEITCIKEGRVEDLQAVTTLNKQIEQLLKQADKPRNLNDEKAFWLAIDQLRIQREKLFKSSF